MQKLKYYVFCTLFILLSVALVGQQVSGKKDITIFGLSYYSWKIPNEALGGIDSSIQSSFIELGRFNVIGMTYRLEDSDVNGFIAKIKDLKGQDVVIPEEVSYGQESFTEADLNKLIGSFIVVIPSVTYFNLTIKKDADGNFKSYETEIKTAFSFLDVENMTMIAHPIIETSGSDEDRNASIQDAIEGIIPQLTLEIKKIPLFTLKTGVLEVYNGGCTIELGKNRGIKPGYEFVVIREEVIKNGLKRENEEGLLIVNKVSEELSEATVLYGKPLEGDQLKEVPRLGLDATAYLHLIAGGESSTIVAIGLRTAVALGFFNFRPIAGIEVPIGIGNDLWYYGIPANAYLGGEFSMYLGRIQLTPSVAVGGGGIVRDDSSSEPFSFTHVGLMGMATINYLFNRDMKITVDAGYAYWYSISIWSNSYNGLLLGGGITLKL